MAVQEGWTGRVYEDFEVGDVYQHPLGRTVSEVDNPWLTLLTMNTNPMHFDATYASKTEFGQLLVNSGVTVAMVLGMSVSDTTQNAFAKRRATKTKATVAMPYRANTSAIGGRYFVRGPSAPIALDALDLPDGACVEFSARVTLQGGYPPARKAL